MFPNLFLRTYWNLDLRPEVFVAAPLREDFKKRFTDVYEPAISKVRVNGVSLTAKRVDLSKTGDSILTEIIDGIAHAQMVLADVSTMGQDSKTGEHYRNANVMYEVGLAVAARQPTEILLVRDDHERFLFDVSTIPHMNVDFTDVPKAIRAVSEELVTRLKTRDLLADTRAELTIASLTLDEINYLKGLASHSRNTAWGFGPGEIVPFTAIWAVRGLCEKRIIKLVGEWDHGTPAYGWTELGYAICQRVTTGLRKLKPDPPIATSVTP